MSDYREDGGQFDLDDLPQTPSNDRSSENGRSRSSSPEDWRPRFTRTTRQSIEAEIFVGYWPLFGGRHNLINRDREDDIRRLLYETRDQYRKVLRNAKEADPSLTDDDIFDIVENFLRNHLYSSKYNVRLRFPDEFNTIVCYVSLPKERSLEVPEENIPAYLHEHFMLMIIREMRKAFYEYIEFTNPIALEQMGIHEYCRWHISETNLREFIESERSNPEFSTRDWIELVEDIAGVREKTACLDLVTPEYIAYAIQVLIRVHLALGALRRNTLVNYSPQIGKFETFLQEVQHWDIWFEEKKTETRATLRQRIDLIDIYDDDFDDTDDTEVPFDILDGPQRFNDKMTEFEKGIIEHETAILSSRCIKKRERIKFTQAKRFMAWAQQLLNGNTTEGFDWNQDKKSEDTNRNRSKRRRSRSCQLD